MRRTHRLSAVRLCLLFLAAVLSSAIVLALAASADPPRAAAASLPAVSVSAPGATPVSKAKASRRKSPSARPTECATAARREKARKACAVKKAKARGIKPSASPKPVATTPSSSPSVASSGAPAPVIAGTLPTEALEVPGSESEPGSTPESPGGATSSPGGSTPVSEPVVPVELKAPIAPVLPVEESKPPVEEKVKEEKAREEKAAEEQKLKEAKAKEEQKLKEEKAAEELAEEEKAKEEQKAKEEKVAEELKPLVEESKPPVEATMAPVEELSQPIKELTPAVEESKATVEAPPTEKASTTTTLASSINPSMVGQSVTYTATVSPATATGTVAFDEAGTPIAGCTAQAVDSGTATCTLSGYTAAGEHALTANYSGDGNYLTSASSSSKQVVDKAGTTKTTMTLSSSLNPSTVGEAVTYTATVAPAVATGTVEFKQSGVTIVGCSAQPVSSGTAKCTIADLAVGWPWITAVYSGDSNYAVSWSTALTQTVNKRTTTMMVSSSLDPSTVGETVTYTAMLSTTAATGTVEFEQAGVEIGGCSAQTVSSGASKCTVANLAAGGHWVTAVYPGDSNYGSSTSSGLTQTVNKKTTTTTVSSSLDPSTVGQAVTYTATVSATAATGAVSFDEAGTPITGCAAQPVSSGTATCAVAGPAAGGHGITAVYSGDSNYAASWSSGFTQTVNKKTTTTMASSSLNPSTVGEAVTYTATVAPAVATGTVEFKQSGVTIVGCSAQPVSSGTAKCTIADLAVGWPWITAVYSGDSNYAVSWSTALTQTVNKRTTTTTVSSSSNPSTVGQAVTYTATVSPATATGTIDFKEEGNPVAGCMAETISSSTTTCTVTGYPKWSSYKIAAAYSGDSNDLVSASSIYTQTVEPPAESAPFRFFSPTSFWNEELPADAPLDPTSAAAVGAFNTEIAQEVAAKKSPTIDTTAWSVPVYTVPANQLLVTVTQAVEYGSEVNTALQSAWDAVPLPANAQPAAGTDKHLVVWQPSTDKLWEFWRLEQTLTGWQAKWGGAIQNASSNSGAYSSGAWPGAQSSWGASATSLSIAGGLITLEDLEKGQINHALAMALPDTRAGVYASPADRTDGEDIEASSLPEGAHLRLEPGLNLASLHLPRLTLMVAEAAQRYGIFIRDTGSNVAFYAQDPIPTGTEPYTGPHGYFEGKSPGQLLASFPWSHLQLLKMKLHDTP